MITSLPIPKKFVEEPSSRYVLSAGAEAEVEEIWQARRVDCPALFNGDTFILEKISGDHAFVQMMEYRFFVAQWERPELYPRLKINTLAVVGTLRTPEGVVWGRRAADSSQLPGVWELAPSGGVDKECRIAGGIDLQKQVLKELEEEIGVREEQLRKVRTACFIHDQVRHIYIHCTEMETDLSFGEIKKLSEKTGSTEHSELALVPYGELGSFLDRHGGELVEFNRMFLTKCGLL